MARDRSLDEFAVDAASDAADRESTADEKKSSAAEGVETDDPGETEVRDRTDEGTQEPGDAEVDGSVDPTADSEVEPATATYQWDPEGLECPDCGRTVDRVWIQGEERVCSDCKEW